MTDNPARPKSAKPLTVSLLAVTVVLIAGVGLILHFKRPFKQPEQPVSVVQPVVLTNAPKVEVPVVAQTKPSKTPPDMETNDFAVSPVKLEKAPGSTLVYVIGKLRNLSGQTRYGVKLEFGLSDTNHQPVGIATDYHSTLEPYGEWNFRAMILESKAVSAHFRSVKEDQ